MTDSPDETAARRSIPPRSFRTLAADERRHALAVLAETERALERDEFVDAVRRRLDGETPRNELHVSLTHVHLPALADEGLLEWEPGSGTIVPTPAGTEVPVLEE